MGDLLSLFPPGSTPTPTACCSSAVAAPTTWPPSSARRSGRRRAALRARAREYADELTAAGPRSRVVFASKAFPCTAVQRVMVEEGLGLDVAGGGEILTAIKAGVDPALIVLHGNAKSDEEIALAVEHGVGLVVVDNSDDVDRLEATVPAGRAPGRAGSDHPRRHRRHARPCAHRSRGFEVRASPGRRGRADPADRAQLEGCGCRACTCTSARRSSTSGRSPSPSRRWRALGEFPVYDLGGGLGARYTWADQPPSIGAYLDALIGAAREHLPAAAQLIIEPGRSMVADAGDARSTGSPPSSGARSRSSRSTAGWATTWRSRCSTSASRPASSAASPVRTSEPVTVVGRHCESGDVLVDGVELAGARGRRPARRTGHRARTATRWPTTTTATAGSPSCSRGDGHARLVVRRETWDDLMARDVD